MLRHSDIRTTMNFYTQDDRDKKQAAQGAFLARQDLEDAYCSELRIRSRIVTVGCHSF
jgi:hypothetical protein